MLGVVVLSVPIQDIIDQVGRANAQMQLVFIITCVIVVVVSFWVAHVIAKPIGELTKVIGKMSEGEVHQRVRVTGSSELSRLGAAFNEMSEQLERIEKNRNEFVSDVSHELKTPLSSMKILIESIIYDENVDLARQREFLQDVNREIDRLSSIIDDLLLLVSLDHSQSPMHTGVIRLDQLGASVVKRMQMLAERRGVALSYEAGGEVTVRADELKIQQAFTNLIDNAIKYTPEGGNVDVMVVRREDRAVVCVTDTGFGIPEEDIKHIVERFYRVEKARTRSAGGTGLGLSIVQRIIKMHNGTLEIRSKEGEGTSVVFELPLFTPPQKEE
jgi:signal transduction histidine kinase